MTKKITPSNGQKPPATAANLREARLKAALKANMARRKLQAKGREAEAAPLVMDVSTDPGDGSGTYKE